jgi:hypothetical protein
MAETLCYALLHEAVIACYRMFPAYFPPSPLPLYDAELPLRSRSVPMPL